MAMIQGTAARGQTIRDAGAKVVGSPRWIATPIRGLTLAHADFIGL